MRIVELILDEEQEIGIEAISVVESPAIEEDFIALKTQEFKLAEVDKEKRILMGALLIPNKPIYRRNGEDEYYIYFSRETVLKASQMYLMQGKQNNSTLEHQYSIQGLSLVESWIVEDKVHDKSVKYGMELPLGTWVGAVKVNNDKIWEEFVKTGKVKGFSIEGYFADKMERPKDQTLGDFMTDEQKQNELAKIEEQEAEYLLNEIRAIIKNDKRLKSGKKMVLESYSDYPKAVKNNAKRGLELNEKVNNKCATQVGKVRAQQLAQGKAVSKETIKRMYSYLSRAEEYYDEGDTKACGTISYLLWGGKAAKRWAAKKIKELELAEVGERGGIKKSPKAPKSDTPNKNPKGKGTAKGDASTSRGAKVSKQDEATLKKKSDEFNERYKEKLGYGVNVGMLKTVFQRGLGAFNVSHSPRVSSASQWAFARVNAFLYLVKNGRPQNKKYTGDFDLLPKGHPKSDKK